MSRMKGTSRRHTLPLVAIFLITCVSNAFAHGEQIIYIFGAWVLLAVVALAMAIFWKQPIKTKLILAIVMVLSAIAWPINFVIGSLIHTILPETITIFLVFAGVPILATFLF